MHHDNERPEAVTGLCIGLMSGTSLDGVDGVLVNFATPRPTVLASASLPFEAPLRQQLLTLNQPGENELHRAALAGNALVKVYADVVARLLAQAGVRAADVRAVGAHGQTVRHRPGEFDGTGYTLQLNQPALLAELCGIAVVADFRSRDVAAGGQGAPLVPPFHRAFFGQGNSALAVLNIGGIANITIAPGGNTAAGPVCGFDCGPGNVLMDAWCQRHTGRAYDESGAWAASGQVSDTLLAALWSDPFFHKPPPKSTGRDWFDTHWLDAHLQAHQAAHAPLQAADVQATLTELTAKACAHSLQGSLAGCQTLVVCGGGAFNTWLMQRLQALLPGIAVQSSAAHGLPPLQVEATAFAWLAWQTLQGKTSSLGSVTGAKGARVLGAIYPA